MALTTFYWARFQAFDSNGDILPNAILEFFEAGTSTPLPVYADVDGNVSLGVTVTADSGGVFAELFMLPQAYDINLYDENNVLIDSVVDWFPPQAASSANLDVTGTAGVAFAAGDGAYLSDGSGALNAGQWYKWDADLAYASETPETAFAVAAIAMGAQGLFRTAGKITGLSGLIPGSLYYISGTAGAIATTAGAFPRMIGQAESTTVLVVQTNPPVPFNVIDERIKALVNGRLTLTTALPVTTADVTAATTLFFALYQGNQIALYSGSRWVTFTIAQLSIAVPAAANTAYDVFVDYNSGTPALSLTAWTSLTARATALTTQNGVLVLTGSTGKRYVGSFRTTAVAGQTEDSEAKRYVWNYYNRVNRSLRRLESTASWTYNISTWRQANAAAANQVEAMIGVIEDQLRVAVNGAANNATAPIVIGIAIGKDSTTAVAANCAGGLGYITAGNTPIFLTAEWSGVPTLGSNTFTWIERVEVAGGATTLYGENQPAAFGEHHGLVGVVRG